MLTTFFSGWIQFQPRARSAVLLHLLWLGSIWIAGVACASSSQTVVTTSGTLTGGDATSALSFSALSTSTFDTGTMSDLTIVGTGSMNTTDTAQATSTSASESLTLLAGGSSTASATGDITASSTTSTSVSPTNTQPCNNHVDFCTRRYSNISEVCAHNSPFVKKSNAGSNQKYGVQQQLDDGVRMRRSSLTLRACSLSLTCLAPVQGQTHMVDGTLYYCHTSCDLLNAGTVESYLTEVADWVSEHPFDVVTILLGNGDYTEMDSSGQRLVTAKNFVEPITHAGLLPWIYQPPKTTMTLDDWPTLSELLLRGKRVVMFIDYNPDTNAVPYLLWEFYNIWETPYSPTDPNFPCIVSRPDGLSVNQSDSMMYMANHNLNVEVSIAGSSILIPNTVALNVTNGVNGSGSLGAMVGGCTCMVPTPTSLLVPFVIFLCILANVVITETKTRKLIQNPHPATYNRPPNFLLVDYYNEGPFNGSVFEVAALANNVTYNRTCCGSAASGAVSLRLRMHLRGFGAIALWSAALSCALWFVRWLVMRPEMAARSRTSVRQLM